MSVFLVICAVIVSLCFIAQTVLMYGIVNHLRQIKEERLLVQRVVSNERWI
jgi:hypothetical protein